MVECNTGCLISAQWDLSSIFTHPFELLARFIFPNFYKKCSGTGVVIVYKYQFAEITCIASNL